MLIKTRSAADVAPSEITPQAVFERRRDFLRLAGAALGGALSGTWAGAAAAAEDIPGEKLAGVKRGAYLLAEAPTPWRDITRFGNYIEFSSDKYTQTETAQALIVKPWTLTLEGLVARPRTLGVEDILKLAPLEERIYRHRCVETWSMVIPWVGLPLNALIQLAQPLGSAKFVEFISHFDPAIMPNGRRPLIPWPYTEALRLDEARHPLTLLAVGLYGTVLPKQNGAPLRLVAPWKYGFKSAKAIVKLRFTEAPPRTSWNQAQGDEYGFYANVNPQVDHPRWSQSRERRVGEFFRRDTLMFNGYADQVASLYAGMDLQANY